MIKIVLLAPIVPLLIGCTLTFQNIDTHGTATDLIDDTAQTSPTVSPTLNVPMK